VIPLGAACSEVENAVVGGAAVSEVAEPGVAFVVDLEVSDPGVFWVAVVSTAHVSERQTSGGIPFVCDVSILLSGVVWVDLDSSGHPMLFAFPNIDYYTSSSSSDGVAGQESVQNSTNVHANDDLCSILSKPGLHQNKILGHCHNKPNLGHDNASDTNDLPMDATTSHSRKTDRRPCLEQHKHRPYQVAR
jgi:hypothetical protein